MDAKSWPVPIKLAVNVSPLQLEFSNVEADVFHALTMAGLSPDRLDIEITEGSFAIILRKFSIHYAICRPVVSVWR